MAQTPSLQDAVDHFRKEEWCAALIDAPGATTNIPMSRRTKSARTGGRAESQDLLFRTMLNNDGSVPHMLAIFPTPDSTEGSGESPALSLMSSALLLDLREGVRGFNGFAHGGFIAAAMDEAMGSLIFANYEYQRGKEDAAVKKGTHWSPPPGVFNMNQGVRIMTASMNIRFRRPVSLPGIVVTTATVSRIDGRKIFLDVEVRDAKNEACATCEGMWMMVLPQATSKKSKI